MTHAILNTLVYFSIKKNALLLTLISIVIIKIFINKDFVKYIFKQKLGIPSLFILYFTLNFLLNTHLNATKQMRTLVMAQRQKKNVNKFKFLVVFFLKFLKI